MSFLSSLFKRSYTCLRCRYMLTEFSIRNRSMRLCPKCGANMMNSEDCYDLRSEEEKRAEADAYSGVSLGPEADRLVAELIEIGKKEEYLSMKPGGNYNAACKHVRARQIGELLNQQGGKDLMVAAAYRVRAVLGSESLSELSSAWAWIGDWAP
jgi:hypothetical protein